MAQLTKPTRKVHSEFCAYLWRVNEAQEVALSGLPPSLAKRFRLEVPAYDEFKAWWSELTPSVRAEWCVRIQPGGFEKEAELIESGIKQRGVLASANRSQTAA